MTDTKLADREPLRLYGWAAAVAQLLIGAAVDALVGIGWREMLLGVLVGPLPTLLGVEVARQRTWSPSSAWLAAVEARREGQAVGAAVARAGVGAGRWTPPPGPPSES